MQYFQFDIFGDASDRTLAFFRDSPKGLELRDFHLLWGIALGEHYPLNARLLMDPRTRGHKLSSFLGNTLGTLIMHTPMKDVVQQTCSNEIEYLPVAIVNHKGRVQSEDYWFVNPLGTVDCVDRAASEIDFDADDPTQILGVTRLALSAAKLVDAPHLFRVPEKKSEYFFSATLVKALAAHDFTNVQLKRVEIA